MTHTRERIVPVLTALGWIALMALVASGFVGRSSSPYGVCYASSGRSVPCEAVARR